MRDIVAALRVVVSASRAREREVINYDVSMAKITMAMTRGAARWGYLVVIQLDVRPVVKLVVAEHDVVLENRIPLLEANLLWARPRLRRDELLQVTDRVVLAVMRAMRRAMRSVERIRDVARASMRERIDDCATFS